MLRLIFCGQIINLDRIVRLQTTRRTAMQASKATVDEVLEAIADCILQCVLFSTEADETGAKVLPPPTTALQSLSSSPLFSLFLLIHIIYSFLLATSICSIFVLFLLIHIIYSFLQLKSLNTDALLHAMKFLADLGTRLLFLSSSLF
jgi:hypothetical protein